MSGERKRVGFEARWHPGPATIQGEYIKMTEERLGSASKISLLAA